MPDERCDLCGSTERPIDMAQIGLHGPVQRYCRDREACVQRLRAELVAANARADAAEAHMATLRADHREAMRVAVARVKSEEACAAAATKRATELEDERKQAHSGYLRQLSRAQEATAEAAALRIALQDLILLKNLREIGYPPHEKQVTWDTARQTLATPGLGAAFLARHREIVEALRVVVDADAGYRAAHDAIATLRAELAEAQGQEARWHDRADHLEMEIHQRDAILIPPAAATHDETNPRDKDGYPVYGVLGLPIKTDPTMPDGAAEIRRGDEVLARVPFAANSPERIAWATPSPEVVAAARAVWPELDPDARGEDAAAIQAQGEGVEG